MESVSNSWKHSDESYGSSAPKNVLTYPMRGDLHAFNTPAEGLRVSIERFNGLREFIARTDASLLLKDHFLSVTVDQLGDQQISSGSQGFMDLGFVMALILYLDIFSKLSSNDQSSLCLRALQLQAEIRQQYGRSSSEETSARIAAAILASGAVVATPSGPLSAVDIFLPSNPYRGPEVSLSDHELDALQSVGRQLLGLTVH